MADKIKICLCTDIEEGTVHKLAIILVEDGKTIVVKEGDSEHYQSLGGRHEGEESFEEGLRREAMEELSIELSDIEFLDRYIDVIPNKNIPIVIDAYFAKPIGELTPANEIVEFLWVDKDHEKNGIHLSNSIIGRQIIPELIKRNLM